MATNSGMQFAMTSFIYTIIKITSVGDARLSVVGMAGWMVILTGRLVSVVDTHYSVSQPGADTEW